MPKSRFIPHPARCAVGFRALGFRARAFKDLGLWGGCLGDLRIMPSNKLQEWKGF